MQSLTFQDVKDFKRRTVESLMEKVGLSDRSVDLEYEESRLCFERMVDEIHELGGGMTEYIHTSRDMFKTCAKLSDVVYDYYWGRLQVHWPSAPETLRSHAAVKQYKESWEQNDSIIRRSATKVWLDNGLTPLRYYMTNLVPDLESELKKREDFIKDYDSYRRRIDTLNERKVTLIEKKKQVEKDGSNPKDINKVTNQLTATNRDLNIVENKLSLAETRFYDQNDKIKKDMYQAKTTRDEILEDSVTTMITCQLELLEQSAQQIREVISLLDQRKVADTRAKLRDLIQKGGPEKVKKGFSDMEKAVQIVTGKALPSDFTSDKKTKSSNTMKSVTGAGSKNTKAENINKVNKKMKVNLGEVGSAPSRKVDSPTIFSINQNSKIQHRKGVGSKTTLLNDNLDRSNEKCLDDLGAEDDNEVKNDISNSNIKNEREKDIVNDRKGRMLLKKPTNAPPPRRVVPPPPNLESTSTLQSLSRSVPPPGPPPKPSTFKVFRALALYDNTAEDEDELSFQKGDIVTVIGEEEGGEWWEAENEIKKRGVVPAVFFKVLDKR